MQIDWKIIYFQLELPLALAQLVPSLQGLFGGGRPGQLGIELLKVFPPPVNGSVALGLDRFQFVHLAEEPLLFGFPNDRLCLCGRIKLV